MLNPSIQELLKLSADENGNQRLNKYNLVMATAKCARAITNDYLKERRVAEKLIADKKTDKDLASLIKNNSYRDEKAVKNAVEELVEGKYSILLPGDEGYEDAIVDVRKLDENLEEECRLEIENQTALFNAKNNIKDEIIDDGEDDEKENFAELMDTEEVYEDQNGYSIEDNENN